jgi:hypothetical protein
MLPFDDDIRGVPQGLKGQCCDVWEIPAGQLVSSAFQELKQAGQVCFNVEYNIGFAKLSCARSLTSETSDLCGKP